MVLNANQMEVAMTERLSRQSRDEQMTAVYAKVTAALTSRLPAVGANEVLAVSQQRVEELLGDLIGEEHDIPAGTSDLLDRVCEMANTVARDYVWLVEQTHFDTAEYTLPDLGDGVAETAPNPILYVVPAGLLKSAA